MKLSFLEKVRLERDILNRVNSMPALHYKLPGLTESAIARWAKAIGFRLDDRLPTRLLELAHRCRLASDKSRDVFDGNQMIESNTIEMVMEGLEKELKIYAESRKTSS